MQDGAKQVRCPLTGIMSATECFAVNGDALACQQGTLIRNPCSRFRINLGRIQPLENSADRRFRWGFPAFRTQLPKRFTAEAFRPVRNRLKAARSRQCRQDGNPRYGHHRMPHSAWFAGVHNSSQQVNQATFTFYGSALTSSVISMPVAVSFPILFSGGKNGATKPATALGASGRTKTIFLCP